MTDYFKEIATGLLLVGASAAVYSSYQKKVQHDEVLKSQQEILTTLTEMCCNCVTVEKDQKKKKKDKKEKKGKKDKKNKKGKKDKKKKGKKDKKKKKGKKDKKKKK
ncbi:hypothetical protein M0812_10774 [Anaeramoeba flamelloides]|uniref:Uncharacterized protein n=1 Tax=Anaeramoeba flamelloides TaxID=1746091 RepID=A0AAV7ZSI1_9EUKA|nr:hypothetical protein M0812_10774 [Anaeramoeba flamelloides]